MPRLKSALLSAVAMILVLTACSTGPSGGAAAGGGSTPDGSASEADASAFPITIKHAFGTATIDRAPTRVVSLGWSDADHMAALGVAPVGAPKVSWGGNANLSTEWFDKQIATFGGQQPTRFDDADGNPIEEIAKLQPDLILATNSGITKEEYDKLSKLADVVAYPEVAYGTPWEVSLEMVGTALGKSTQAADIAAKTKGVLEAAKAKHPQLAGKSFIYAYIAPTDLSQIGFYTPSDLRPQMLTELGMVNAPFVTEASKGKTDFYLTVSSERASTMKSDVILTYITEDSDVEVMKKDPLISQVPAIKSGALVATKDEKVGLTMSSPTPLSIPYMTELFVPLIAAAADKAA